MADDTNEEIWWPQYGICKFRKEYLVTRKDDPGPQSEVIAICPDEYQAGNILSALIKQEREAERELRLANGG
jgi:hypothetical protein